MVAPLAVSHRPSQSAAVIITSHNYGRYLADAIRSVLTQTFKVSEIVVVDDASTDNTATVAASFADRGVRYARIDARSVYLARKRGMDETTSPLLMFLDADDTIARDYVQLGQACFANPAVGIAYTDLILNRPGGERRHYPAVNIESKNFIHAGALVRRIAIEQADGFGEPRHVINTRADWFLWRRLLRAGWQARHFDAEYYYLQHEAAVHNADASIDYFDLASLDKERVTIVLPLSGRERYLKPLRRWVSRQSWDDIELLVIDSSEDRHFQSNVRAWQADVECPTSFVSVAGINGLADADRRQHAHFRAVQQIMPRIYRELRRVQTEYALVVEEDVIPPEDAIPRLIRGFREDVAAVAGVYRSRWTPENLLVWDFAGQAFQQPRAGLEHVGGTGFGCLLYRRSAFSQIVLHAGGNGNFDPNAGDDLRTAGWRWFVDWDVRCVHDGISV